MTVRRISPFGWSALAVVVAVLATPVSAFGWHHHSSGYKVKMWGTPMMIGSPVVLVGVQGQSALLTTGFAPQSALLTTGFGAQSALLNSGLTFTPQVGLLAQSGIDPQAGPSGGVSSGNRGGVGGGNPPTVTTVTTTTCPELASRLDKIEGRLTTLEGRLGKIEDKVDSLIAARNAEQQRQAREQEVRELETRIINQVDAARRQDLTTIIGMFNETQRRNMLLVDELMKPADKQSLKSLRDELAKPFPIPNR